MQRFLNLCDIGLGVGRFYFMWVYHWRCLHHCPYNPSFDKGWFFLASLKLIYDLLITCPFFFKWINGFCTFEKFLYDFAILRLILVPYGFVNMVLPYSTAGIQVYGIQVLWTSLRGNHLALTKLKIKSICHCFTFKNSVMYKCYVKMLIFHILVAVLLTICIWYVVL